MATSTERTEMATQLHAAYERGESFSPPEISVSISEGYEIQREFVEARIEREGPAIGYKLGFTNEQIQREIGVEEPAYGQLLAETVHIETIRTSDLVDPRIEPEIVVRLDDPVSPSASRSDVARVVGGVAPAIEVVDTRTGTWSLDPGLAVADNALASRLAIGPERPLAEAKSLADIEVTVTSGDTVRTGHGDAVLGDPLFAVAWLAEQFDEPLDGGTIISTGSLTQTVGLERGESVTASFSTLGELSIPVE